MTGAMYAAIAGLRTHMQNLNVIGNNIANVNTFGYKPGRSVFRSAIYTQISGGREGTTTTGGKNPSQIGYGANLGSVDVDMSTGTYSPGKSTDMMIDGDGFFLVGDKTVANVIDPKDPTTFKSLTLTRVGDMDFKEDGYLSDSVGNVVYGFLVVGMVNGEPIFSDQLVPIRYPRQDGDGNVLYPQLVREGGGAAGGAGGADQGKLVLQDTLRPKADGGNNQGGNAGADDEVTEDYAFAQFDSVSIGSNGLITGTTRDTGKYVVIGAIALGTVTNPSGVTQLSNTYYQCGQGAGDLTVNMMGGLNRDVYVTDGSTTWGDNMTLPGANAPANGIKKGMDYVNGSQANSGNGGQGDVKLPNNSQVLSAGTTALLTGGLELSKTDLATEIANMITTQRGYQANTRIITVTDSMLEELVNMKR